MDIFLSHYIQSESLNFFPDVSNSWISYSVPSILRIYFGI
jgi:hypothetical protein